MQTNNPTTGQTTVISTEDNKSQNASWFDLKILHANGNILTIKSLDTCISRKPNQAVKDKPEQYKFPGNTLDRACSELNILHTSNNIFISITGSDGKQDTPAPLFKGIPIIWLRQINSPQFHKGSGTRQPYDTLHEASHLDCKQTQR